MNAQLTATAMHLRKARKSGDVNEIQAALLTVPRFELPDDNSLYAEVQGLAADLRQRVVEDADLARLNRLRRSRDLKYQIHRLWDLMVVESDRIRDEAEVVGSTVVGKRGAPGHVRTPFSMGARAPVSLPGGRPG